jgi:single-strand DNA-binding protein
VINKVILVGRITKDPELKKTSSDVSFINFSLAVNRTYADAQGERQADFINCVVWRNQADNLAKYVSKGALLGVEGRIQTRQYESDNGTRYVTEVLCDNIQFLESKGSSSPSQETKDSEDFYETTKKLVAEDDLPF